MKSYNESEIKTSSSNNAELGKQVRINEKVDNKPRWPDFKQSIDKAASEGKTCFFEFKEKQEKDENGRPYYYSEYNGLREVMDEGKQDYKDFKAFIKKHESDFKKLVRKHDLMLVYLYKRVFLVPTRYLKNKEQKNIEGIIKKMITPIVNYHKQCYKKMKKNYYIYTHGTGHYDPLTCGFVEEDGHDLLEFFPIKEMSCVLTNNNNGLVASTYGMQQRGKRQGRVVNALLNEIAVVVREQGELKKSSLHISANSFGNVVNNFIMDQLLNKDDGVLRPVEGGESAMNATYYISAPYFHWPFTPSYEHIYGSLLHHELPSNFIIEAPSPSNCCLDLLHPKCVINGIKDILGTSQNTSNRCEWLQNK